MPSSRVNRIARSQKHHARWRTPTECCPEGRPSCPLGQGQHVTTLLSYRGLVSSILAKYEGASMSSKLLAIDDRNKSVGLAMARPADFTCHEVGPIDPTCVLEDATISGQALEVLACASADSVATSARTAWWVCDDAIQNDKRLSGPF